MSAAKKLEALLHRAETSDRGWDNDIHGEPLLMALPQIVAVTLWAEQTIQNFDEYGEVSFIPLIDALEELDKALS